MFLSCLMPFPLLGEVRGGYKKFGVSKLVVHRNRKGSLLLLCLRLLFVPQFAENLFRKHASYCVRNADGWDDHQQD